jgi:hypothetical protein
MAISLRIDHKEGLRLRQQQAKQVEYATGDGGGNGAAMKGTEWAFDGADCQQDTDPRRVDNKGKPLPLGTYTVHIAANLRNLVIERKGKVDTIQFRNSALRNQMKIRQQEFIDSERKDKTGKHIKEWKTTKQEYVPANTWTGVYAGDGIRAICDEVPT